MAYKVPIEKYRRSPPPALPESQGKYLQEELRKLELVLDSKYDGFNEVGQWKVQTDNAILELQSTVTAGSSNILQNYYTKADTDAAIAASATTLTTNFNNTLSGYATTSYLNTNYYTKSGTDAAIASASTSLSSSFDAKLANYTTTAGLQANYYTKAATDSAIAASATSLTTNFNNTLQGYATNATLTTNYYTKSATDSAIASANSSLSTSFDNKLTGYATTASLTSESNTRASADSALSSQITSLSATTNAKNKTFYQSTAPTASAVGDLWFDTGNGNLVKRWDGTNWVATDDSRIAGNAAAITNEASVRASADSALSTQINTVSASINNANSSINSLSASLQNETTARVNGDSALSSQITSLTSTVNSNNSTLTAAISSEASTRANADTALSTQISTVSAAAAAAQSTANSRNKTFLQSTSPTASAVGDIWINTSDSNKLLRWDGSTWSSADDARIATNAAAITTEATARASADSALATQINSLSTTVNGNTTSISTLQSSVNGVTGRYGVTINNNGYISGISLLSDSSNGNPTSVFRVAADKFAVRTPGASSDSIYWDSGTSKLIVGGDIYANSFNGTGVVGTGNIASRAVTQPSSAYTASGITVGTSWDTVQTLTYTASGEATCVFFSLLIGFGDTYSSASVRVLRNGSVIFNPGLLGNQPLVSMQFTDTPAAGSVTYELQCFVSNSTTAVVALRSLVALELKR